jgi:hypothetical protein
MYELEKMVRYLRVNLLGPGPPLIKKRIYRAAVSQRLRNTVIEDFHKHIRSNAGVYQFRVANQIILLMSLTLDTPVTWR